MRAADGVSLMYHEPSALKNAYHEPEPDFSRRNHVPTIDEDDDEGREGAAEGVGVGFEKAAEEEDARVHGAVPPSPGAGGCGLRKVKPKKRQLAPKKTSLAPSGRAAGAKSAQGASSAGTAESPR